MSGTCIFCGGTGSYSAVDKGGVFVKEPCFKCNVAVEDNSDPIVVEQPITISKIKDMVSHYKRRSNHKYGKQVFQLLKRIQSIYESGGDINKQTLEGLLIIDDISIEEPLNSIQETNV